MRLSHLLYKIEPMLVRFYHAISEPPTPNLKGDRDIEYSWVASRIPRGPGKALDFGAGHSWMGLLVARRGLEVTTLDLEEVAYRYCHPRLRNEVRDLFKLSLPPESLDVIVNCSTVEHVGIVGRYGIKENRAEGDLDAMRLLRDATRPGGLMILTIPVGLDAVFAPHYRVYGPERLPRLLAGWEVVEEEYWTKDSSNRWVLTCSEEALHRQPSDVFYNLGLFVLQKPLGPGGSS